MHEPKAEPAHTTDADDVGTDRRSFMRKLTVGGVGAAAGVALLNEKAAAIPAPMSNSYFPLSVPMRIYDSRVEKYDTNGRSENSMKFGLMYGGEVRRLFVMDGRDQEGNIIEEMVIPAEATAAQLNITIVNTELSDEESGRSGGYLSVRAGSDEDPFPVYSAWINWNSDGLVVANSSAVGVGPFPSEPGGIVGNAIDVICGPTGNGVEGVTTDLVVDVFGYYAPGQTIT